MGASDLYPGQTDIGGDLGTCYLQLASEMVAVLADLALNLGNLTLSPGR